MARPAKTKVDYFPHMTHSGKTIAILEARWGNDGYAFWFKLLELLGDSNDFSFNCNHSADWEYLLSKTRVTEPVALAILDKLAEIDAIDDACWAQKIVWSDNFVRNLEPVFEKRKRVAPQKPEFLEQKPAAADESGNFRDGNSAEPGIIPTEIDKVKERKGEKSEAEEPEEPEKACAVAGAPLGESESVSATEKPDDSNGKPVAEAEPAKPTEQQQNPVLVLPESPAAEQITELPPPESDAQLPAKNKRHGLKPAQYPCPSRLRPGVLQQADTVFLTPDELAKLCREYGDDGAQRLVEILDAYKTNNPEKSAKYRDDFKVIRSWVIRRFREELDYAGQNKRASPATGPDHTFIGILTEMAREESEL